MDDLAATAVPAREATAPSTPRYPGLAALPDGKVRSAAADAAVYTAGVYGAQLLLFVAGVVQKGLLGPTATGYWALMATFYAFFNIAPLGAFDGAVRQIPFHRGRDDRRGAAALADTASSFTVLAVTVASLLVSSAAVAFGSSWPAEIRYGLILLAFGAPLRFLIDCHESVLQATKRFDVVSLGLISRAVIAVTLQTLFVLLWGYWGMFAGVTAMAVGQLLLWNRMGLTSWSRPAFRRRIEGRRLKELIAFGFPMMIHAQIWLLFLAIDNLIVARFLDVTQLGYYALAVSVTTYIMLLPKGIAGALAPRMAERFGRTGDVSSIRDYATDVQQLLAYLLIPVLVAAAFFLMPVLIRHALPEFMPAIPVVRITVAASFFISLTNMPIKVMLTSGRNWRLVSLMLACLAFNGLANYLAVAVLDRGLEGAAFATALSYFVLFVVVSSFALRGPLGTRGVTGHIAELVVVFVYVSAALWGIEWIVGPGGGGLGSDLLTGTAEFALFLVTLAPWAALVERRYKGLSAARAALTDAARALRRWRLRNG
ncbi:MAG TPA: oligosaccharide flippase family protein [Thermoleophilaceae bacterium]